MKDHEVCRYFFFLPDNTSTGGMKVSLCMRRPQVTIIALLQLSQHHLLLVNAMTIHKAVECSRRQIFGRLAGFSALTFVATLPQTAMGFGISNPSKPPTMSLTEGSLSDGTNPMISVGYKSLALPMDEFGVDVPVACWFPLAAEQETSGSVIASYQHRISVRRIGQLLARWDFIPQFVSKDIVMAPASQKAKVVDSTKCSIPDGPVVLLAHGYLGSRFDLSDLAEELASEGFVCIAAEYPESLAASYERIAGLDRKSINDSMLNAIANKWNIKATAFGIVGHSLGCGTVQQTGDKSWARVSIAGFPRNRDGTPLPGNGLLLTSINDGAVSIARYGGASLISDCNYEIVDEASNLKRLPRRAAVVFDRPDAPNHISFLSEGVNDAMIDFLSPLLPVAQAMKIPVLDFDQYKLSRDSKETAAIVHPLVVKYLKQEMGLRR